MWLAETVMTTAGKKQVKKVLLDSTDLEKEKNAKT